jgi:hypothetical protein
VDGAERHSLAAGRRGCGNTSTLKAIVWKWFAVVVAVLAAMGQAPRPVIIPETAQWEVAFRQVEEAAGLQDMRTLPQILEARIMQRAWADPGGLGTPFLRLVRTAGVVQAQRLVFGTRADLQRLGIRDGDIRCPKDLCVGTVAIAQRLDWESMVTTLATTDPCPPLRPDIISICGDCLQLWIKTFVNGRYLEQSCQAPLEGTLARQLIELLHQRPH